MFQENIKEVKMLMFVQFPPDFHEPSRINFFLKEKNISTLKELKEFVLSSSAPRIFLFEKYKAIGEVPLEKYAFGDNLYLKDIVLELHAFNDPLCQKWKHVFIKDCIFLGGFGIEPYIAGGNFYIRDSLVLENFSIFKFIQPEEFFWDVVDFNQTNIQKLHLIGDLQVCNRFRVNCCKFQEMRLSNLYVPLIKFCDNKIGTSVFDHVNTNVDQNYRYQQFFAEVEEEDLLEIRDFFVQSGEIFNSSNAEKNRQVDQISRRYQTIEFIQKNTDLKNNLPEWNKLEYEKQLLHLGGTSRFWNNILGGFIKPSRFLLLALLTLIFLGLGYALCPNFFNPRLGNEIYPFLQKMGMKEHLKELLSTILDGLYFSGISLTTIGYGDIHPKGLIKFIAILEGGIGIFLGAGFVVSLSRKLTGK